jgi:hypothetical protein
MVPDDPDICSYANGELCRHKHRLTERKWDPQCYELKGEVTPYLDLSMIQYINVAHNKTYTQYLG